MSQTRRCHCQCWLRVWDVLGSGESLTPLTQTLVCQRHCWARIGGVIDTIYPGSGELLTSLSHTLRCHWLWFVIDATKPDSEGSLTPLRQTLGCHWRRWACLRGVIATVRSDLRCHGNHLSRLWHIIDITWDRCGDVTGTTASDYEMSLTALTQTLRYNWHHWARFWDVLDIAGSISISNFSANLKPSGKISSGGLKQQPGRCCLKKKSEA